MDTTMNTTSVKTQKSLGEIIADNERVVVKFEGKWCQPCKQIQPVLEKALSHYNGSIIFRKADVETHQEEAAIYGVMTLPTIVYFRNGSPLAATSGLVTESEIKANIDKYLFG
jgi:thioredoxin